MALPDLVKRKRFASEYAVCGNATQAAKHAGVPAASAHSMGYKWLRNPEVLEMVRSEIDSRLRDLAPIAVSVLHNLMLDANTPAQVRLSAARDVLDRMGWVPPKRENLDKGYMQRELTKLTRGELEMIARSGNHERVLNFV